MTREEAIRWLIQIKRRYIFGGDEGFDASRKEALDMAIEALQWQDRILTQIEDIVLKEHGERREL